MSKVKRTDLQETTLVLTDKELFIKERKAFRNTNTYAISGASFFYLLPIINASARDKTGKLPTKVRKKGEQSIIDVTYRENVPPNGIVAIELALLIDETFVNEVGNMKHLNWGKEFISDIHFLHTKPYFVSAIGNYREDKKKVSITPISSYKSIISHAKKGTTIQIEYMPKNKSVPTILWRDNFHISNNSSQPAENINLEFLVPRNDKYQKVDVSSSSNIELSKDKDQNAWAKLSIPLIAPNEQRTVSFDYYIRKKPYMFTTEYGTLDLMNRIKMAGGDTEVYFKGSKLWPIEDEKVQRIKNKILEGEREVFNVVKLIFEFVNQSFEYEVNGIRMSAAEILQTRKGDCSEFSDLFVTLCRACNIPARIIGGFTWDRNGDVLTPHAWCEVFTKQGWIPLDPLWGFLQGISFFHIMFSKEGIDVDYPAYRYQSIGGNIDIKRTYSLTIK